MKSRHSLKKKSINMIVSMIYTTTKNFKRCSFLYNFYSIKYITSIIGKQTLVHDQYKNDMHLSPMVTRKINGLNGRGV